ncbi:L,D-transpeptidase [Gelidibacter gilvus]|uniref:Murein L,D-transpeptidase n=1 Tax=Gelidibacter gilvus TaxID=59602 RepID=A0A4Q0XH71_9FLAO|nr:L,D-transpeptidase [Gelidibacter gilvus]RXJ49657.1 murein L,D-transpeptidase [Gelidibacter gilvus]
MKNISVFILSLTLMGCVNSHKTNNEKEEIVKTSKVEKPIVPIEITINKDVPIHSYFKWMDSIVATHNRTHNYAIDEYLIVHHNKWIIDTLANTDYYYLMDKGIFNEDSQALIALKKDQVLIIPDSLETLDLRAQLSNTYLELNIPEFRLRIIQDEKEVYKFPVRVGKVGKKYMVMAKGHVDMRTKTGIGEIIRVNKEPTFANPVTNSKYKKTVRDDGKVTALPAIPWLEPSINGVRVGQLIHPTTNLGTLGRASSNGCIGLRESHAWIVYYYAPLGTKVVSKYELHGTDDHGEPVKFKDIYPGFESLK